jgi:hypothetical protein
LIDYGLAAKVNGFSFNSSYIIGSGMLSRAEMGLNEAKKVKQKTGILDFYRY